MISAPADAYFEMVDLLGDSHFLTQPLSVGTELIIRGRDGIPTVWAMTDAQALWLKPYLTINRHLTLDGVRHYESASL